MTNLQNQISRIVLEESECGVCGSHHYKTLYAAPTNSQYSGCSIVQCSNCSLVRTNPRPSQNTLFETYTDDYYSRKSPNLKSLASRYKIFAMQKKVSFLYPYLISQEMKSNAKICDVGCGSGQWLSLMRQAYPKISLYGFEIDQETAQIAIENCSGNGFHYGDLLKNSWESNSFDFLTLWDVLEHTSNPRDTMLELARLVKPGGYVLLSVPDFDCLYSRIFQSNWWSLAFDAHLYHFTKKTLSQLVEDAGLEVVMCAKPMIHPKAAYNIDNLLKEMDSKRSNKSAFYHFISMVKLAVELLDKSQISRLFSDHIILHARKKVD